MAPLVNDKNPMKFNLSFYGSNVVFTLAIPKENINGHLASLNSSTSNYCCGHVSDDILIYTK